jgi:23S rRNA pseudouridine1911/1915/1917 synthase
LTSAAGAPQQDTVIKEHLADGPQPRLDSFLAGREPGLTRSQIRRYIEQGLVRLNGDVAKGSQRLRLGDVITLTIPPPRPTELVAQWMALTVVYQDGHLVVIDKPPGLSVHPGPGHSDRTLVNGLLALCPDLKDAGGIGGEVRPGIVHRLDKDTSGLMIVAKNQQAHNGLSAQFKERRVTKGYIALVSGVPARDAGIIDAPIGRDPRHRKRMAVVAGGREARTRYRVLEQVSGWSLVELYLESGRTHQIRVHMAYLGHPLMADRVYGRANDLLERHFLHANHLGFQHPATGEPMEFRSDLPQDLALGLERLRAG